MRTHAVSRYLAQIDSAAFRSVENSILEPVAAAIVEDRMSSSSSSLMADGLKFAQICYTEVVDGNIITAQRKFMLIGGCSLVIGRNNVNHIQSDKMMSLGRYDHVTLQYVRDVYVRCTVKRDGWYRGTSSFVMQPISAGTTLTFGRDCNLIQLADKTSGLSISTVTLGIPELLATRSNDQRLCDAISSSNSPRNASLWNEENGSDSVYEAEVYSNDFETPPHNNVDSLN